MRTYKVPPHTIKRNTEQINAIFGGVFAYCYMCIFASMYARIFGMLKNIDTNFIL